MDGQDLLSQIDVQHQVEPALESRDGHIGPVIGIHPLFTVDSFALAAGYLYQAEVFAPDELMVLTAEPA